MRLAFETFVLDLESPFIGFRSSAGMLVVKTGCRGLISVFKKLLSAWFLCSALR